jgi:hypothetical protein
VVAFILASAVVGYFSESQSLSSQPAVPGMQGYSVLYGPVPLKPSQVAVYSTTGSATGIPSSYGGRMVEQEGYVALEVADTKSASEQASNLAYSMGGYVASSSFDQFSSSSSFVLR